MNPQATVQLPMQASTVAPDVDWVYYVIFWVSVAFFVVITLATVWFAWRYRRRPGVAPAPTGHNTTLEVAWTFLPLVLLWFLFKWGFDGYMAAAVSPDDALPIRVRGMQWSWEFEHPNGAIQLNELTVPVNRPVKLIMSSSDVLHSFFVPAFRVKKDVVPGMYTSLWFEATQKGDMQVFCTEYCGAPPGASGNAGHSNMLAKIHVVEREAYDKFIEEGPAMPEGITPAQWGQQLFTQFGCPTCHNVDGQTAQPAPNLKGILGRQERFADGSALVVDEDYIRESIAQPQAKIVAGYTNVVMPPFRMADRQVDAVISYLRSLGEQ